MVTKNESRKALSCEAVARAALGEPAKPWGQQPEPDEGHFLCPRHDDHHPSLKINRIKNTWSCFTCGVAGNAWELLAWKLGKDPKWKSLGRADQKEVTDWLREHGLLLAKGTASRSAKKKSYPILREFIYRNWDSGELIGRRVRFDVPVENKEDRFRWFHPDISKDPGGEGGENIQWKPGSPNLKDLHLYIGLPEPKDKQIFDSYVAQFKNSPEVFLTEGEHDADAGAAIGLATVTSGGTSSLEILRNNQFDFQDKTVVIVTHPGPKELVFSEKAAAILYSGATQVKIIKATDFCPIAGIKDLADAVTEMTKDGHSNKGIRETISIAVEHAPAWKPEGGEEILDAAYKYLRRFGKVTHAQAVALILWIAYAFIYKGWRWIPYLHIYSPERGEGKSTILDLLAALLGLPWGAVMIRPTLPSLYTDLEESGGRPQLIDEFDFMVTGHREIDGPLYAYLNAGCKRGATVPRTKLEGGRRNERFPTLCPKVICGRNLESLDDSTRDRCIGIRMQKANWEDRVKYWVEEFHLSEGQQIGARIQVWCESLADKIWKLDFLCTTSVGMRVIDLWRPLLSIAEVAGEKWLEWVHSALIELATGPEAEHDSQGVRLLRGILRIRDTRPVSEGIHSADLATGLQALGGEFLEYGRKQKPITANRISRILERYGIKSEQVWLDGKNLHGYRWAQLEKAWKSHLPEYTGSSVSERLGSEVPSVLEGTPKLMENQQVTDNPSVLAFQNGGSTCVQSSQLTEIDGVNSESAKNGVKWVRFSELRTMMRGQGRHPSQPQITFLDTDPEARGLPRLTIEGHGGVTRETAALGINSDERRPANQSGAQQAIWRPGGIEFRKR
jgi:putative DNA primase/helicase